MGAYGRKCKHCSALYFDAELETSFYGFCCQKGQVQIPPLEIPSPYIKSMLVDTSKVGVHFRAEIRSYNGSLAFGTIKASTVSRSGHERDRGRQCYMIQGQVYAQTYNSALPRDNTLPRGNQFILSRPTVEKLCGKSSGRKLGFPYWQTCWTSCIILILWQKLTRPCPTTWPR